MSDTMLNTRGEWVPAIPLPYYLVWGCRCSCGEKFWTTRAYEGHYALVHILGMAR